MIANSSSPATRWSPAARCANRVAATAAIPDDDTTASSAPSSEAIFSSSARFVGLPGARVEVRAGLPGQRAVDRLLLLGGRVEGERRRGVDRRAVRVGRRVRPLPAWMARVARPRPPSVPASSPRPPRGSSLPGRSVYGRLSCADGSDRLVAPPRPRARGPPGRGLDPGRVARVRRRGQGPLAGDARRAIRARTAGGSPTSSVASSSHERRDPGIRGELPAIPARPAGPRPLPRRGVRQRLRLRHR